MASSILVGIDGTERGAVALEWAAGQADRGASALVLMSVIDPRYAHRGEGGQGALRKAVQEQLDEARAGVAKHHPAVPVRTLITTGGVIDCLVDEADRHDMVVMGSHHGRGIGQTVSGARGLRVSVSSKVPTAVVPCDWTPQDAPRGITVGVGPDEVSEGAIAFGLKAALSSGQPLRLVSAWGLPALLSKPARAMGSELSQAGEEFQQRLDERVGAIRKGHPDLEVTGEAIEGSSPSAVLADAARDCGMLVLGTHSRTALGRTMFGSVTHSVLANLVAPTVIVPQC